MLGLKTDCNSEDERVMWISAVGEDGRLGDIVWSAGRCNNIGQRLNVGGQPKASFLHHSSTILSLFPN